MFGDVVKELALVKAVTVVVPMVGVDKVMTIVAYPKDVKRNTVNV